MDARNVQFENIREIASLINGSTGLPAVLSRIVSGVCKNNKWDASAIMAVDRDAGVSEQLAVFDPENYGKEGVPTRWTLSISASLRAVDENRPIIVTESNADTFPELQRYDLITGHRTTVMLPLGATDDKGREMTLSVSSRANVKVENEEISFLLTLAHLAAIAINKEKTLQHERGLSTSLKRAFDIGFSLIERELELGSLDLVLQRVKMVMKHPFVLMDHQTGELMAHGSPIPDKISSSSWSILVGGSLSDFFAQLAKAAKASDFQDVARVTLPLDQPSALGAIVEPLNLNGQHVGTLIVFPPEGGMDSADRVIAQAVRFAINVQFVRDYFLSREESGSLSALFGSLLEGTYESEREVQRRARQLGIDLRQPACLLAIDIDLAGLDPVTIAALNRVPSSLRLKVAITSSQGILLAYVPEFERGRSVVDSVERELSRRISQCVRQRFAYTRSDPIKAIPDFAPAFDRCSRILLLAQHAGKEGRVRESDFGAFPLLLGSIDQLSTKSFVAEILHPIEEYDAQNNTDLLTTVEAFVVGGRKFQATARHLGIHLSTLRYRITRLKEFFGIDAEDSETAFNLALAFRIKAVAGLTKLLRPEVGSTDEPSATGQAAPPQLRFWRHSSRYQH